MHIKYRPKTWEEVVGHENVKKALAGKKHSSTILLCGERGIGKTTIAYILADQFGCDSKNIEHYNCFQFSGVDAIRKVIQNIPQPTFFGNKKVLILDEIHGLSPQAQQALLIPLESLPENVLVVACTTELSKVKDTFISRFVKFDLNPLTNAQMLTLLNRVCSKEKITFSKAIKILLVKNSSGIPRLLLTAIPKIKDITSEEEIQKILTINELEEYGDAFELFKLLLSERTSWKIINTKINSILKTQSADSLFTSLIKLISYRITTSNDPAKLYKLYNNLIQPVRSHLLKDHIMINLRIFCG